MKKYMALALIAALAGGGCAIKASVQGSLFKKDTSVQEGADHVAFARTTLTAGKPRAEVIDLLQKRGLSEDEAEAIVSHVESEVAPWEFTEKKNKEKE